ncbi:MAG: DUF4271 domain-containing protein [Cyclobacteriaceae bacterium]
MRGLLKKKSRVFLFLITCSFSFYSQSINKVNYLQNRCNVSETNTWQHDKVANYLLNAEKDSVLEIVANSELTVLYNGAVVKRVIEYPAKLRVNPFDTLAYITIVNPKQEEYKVYNQIPKKRLEESLDPFSLKRRINNEIEFKWVILFFILMTVVATKKVFPSVYSYIKSTDFSSDYFISSSTISNASLSPFLISLIAYLLSAVFCALVISMQATRYQNSDTEGIFFILFFAIFSFLVIKNLFTAFISYLFEFQNSKLYNLVYAKITVLVFLGVFLLYLIIPKNLINLSLNQSILLILSFLSFAVVWVSLFIFKTERFRIGYLISYICTAEILPILFLLYLLTV